MVDGEGESNGFENGIELNDHPDINEPVDQQEGTDHMTGEFGLRRGLFVTPPSLAFFGSLQRRVRPFFLFWDI